MLYRRAVGVILISVIFLGASIMPVQADELSDALEKQQQILEQQKQAKGELQELTYTADKITEQIAVLDAQIVQADQELTQKQQAYTEAEAQVVAAEQELRQKEQELEERRQTLGQRVHGIYVDGQVNYLEILFQSSSLADFISRAEYLNRLVDNDRELLEDIQKQKEEITVKKAELEQARDVAAQYKAEAEAAKQQLDYSQSQKEIALAQNQQAQEETLIQIAKLEKDSEAIGQVIKEIQDRQARGFIGNITVWPLTYHHEISSAYGWRIHPITGNRSLHSGIDIPAPTGTPIHAAGDGVVIFSGWYGAYGYMVIIDHGDGRSTLYGHQSRLAVKEGQTVAANQVIGYVGSTGWSTGPHLHFEVRENGNPVNPLEYY